MESVEGERHGDAAALDVGAMLPPNEDWWTFDTAHMSVADVQVCDLGERRGKATNYNNKE